MPSTSKRIALGIDIGGTKIKTVALEAPDRVLLENRIDSHANQGPNAVRKSVAEAVQFYRNNDIHFSCIGIGCAGAVDPHTGVVLNSPNFAEWKNVPLRTWAEQDFDCPVLVGNDAKCAAFTEWKLGNARGKKNAILLTFGTGIGGGLILDGKLYYGSTGSAGELGHFSIHANGKPCPCGNRGCFERYCSASALEERVKGYTAKEIFARRNEEPFKTQLNEFLAEVKIGVVSLANVFDPDCILIGGGLSKGLAQDLPDLQKWVQEHAFPSTARHVQVIQTQYLNQSGAIGAALLALEECR